VYSERRSEFKAYLRAIPIGVIASAQQGIGSQLPMTWSYQLEYGRTAAQPAFFCAVFNVCEADVRERLERYTGAPYLAGPDAKPGDRPDPTTDGLDPPSGSPRPWADERRELQQPTFDAWYVAMGGIRRRPAGTAVVHARAFRFCAQFIPLPERLRRGPKQARGFRQNELVAYSCPINFPTTKRLVQSGAPTLIQWVIARWRQAAITCLGQPRAAIAVRHIRSCAIRCSSMRAGGIGVSWPSASLTFVSRRVSGCACSLLLTDPRRRWLQRV
jgi:hypothetical protein